MLLFTWMSLVSPLQSKQILDVLLSAFLPQGRESVENLSDYFYEKITPRLAKGHLVHCVFVQDKIVGFIIFKKWEGKSYYLAEMAVLPEYQGQGIGKQLVFSIFDKDQAAEKILLLTEKANKWAQSFYEKIGFERSVFQLPDYPEGFMGYEFHRKVLD
jgi:ribosomal protein S18 acetylase RimI-like enzyme